MPRARLICFEGTEGSGKSTLIRSLSDSLAEQGIPHIVTREPGGSALGEKIRGLILNNAMHPWTELFLYEAARHDHVQEKILPALKNDHWVLCDRFTDSSLAYQSGGRGLDFKKVQSLNRIATSGLKADLTITLNLPVELGLKRATDQNRFEREKLQFHKRIQRTYLKLARSRGSKSLLIQTKDRSPEWVHAKVLSDLQRRKWIHASS